MTMFTDNAWLAGFADGEANFHIQRQGGPRFTITLRIDDVGVLYDLQSEFGGSVSVKPREGEGNRNPCVSWAVVSKNDLAKIVTYFDRFQLRAKKVHDYAIWRAAVDVYTRHGYKTPELQVLKTALEQVRAYNPETGERYLRAVS